MSPVCINIQDHAMLPQLFCKFGGSVPNTHSLHWRHNGRDSVSNHQPHDCLLKRLFRRRSNKTSKLRVTGLCTGNSPGTGEFPAQMASNAENVSICWRHHGVIILVSSSGTNKSLTSITLQNKSARSTTTTTRMPNFRTSHPILLE